MAVFNDVFQLQRQVAQLENEQNVKFVRHLSTKGFGTSGKALLNSCLCLFVLKIVNQYTVTLILVANDFSLMAEMCICVNCCSVIFSRLRLFVTICFVCRTVYILVMKLNVLCRKLHAWNCFWLLDNADCGQP